jgi:serine/threonine protein kinase
LEKRTFNLAITDERIRFALELYNFCSALHAESGEGNTHSEVKKLAARFRHMKLPTFPTNHDGNYEGATAQLASAGYEVVPDVIETKGGTWELIDKVQHMNHVSIYDVALTTVLQPPPNIRRLCRRNHPNQIEYFAKHVRKGSSELAIHDYLRARQSQSPHIISLVEATREWLILPKLCSIRDQWFINTGGVAGRVRLGSGLVKGLAYLHEHKIAHRDIKPNNLVCDGNFVLKIIDFDTAIDVEDENTEVDDYCGTQGWTAPDLGRKDGLTAMHSPIKADRWSCGRVLLRHLMVGKGDVRLSIYANELMAKDPDQRPSLLEWHKSPFSDVASVLEDSVSQPRRDMEDVDELPATKRPRLE